MSEGGDLCFGRSCSRGILFTAWPFKMDLGQRLAFSLSRELLFNKCSMLVTWPPGQGAWAGHSQPSAPPPRGGTAVCLQTHRRCPTAGARRGRRGAVLLGLLEVEQHGQLDRGGRPAVGCERREQGRRPWEPFVPQTVCVRRAHSPSAHGGPGGGPGVVPGSEEKQSQAWKGGRPEDPGDGSPQARASSEPWPSCCVPLCHRLPCPHPGM